MTDIGKLMPSEPKSLSHLTGSIETLDASLSVRLDGDEALCDARQPSHRIYARNRSGNDIQIGSAWLKTAKHGPRAGDRFLTLSIDYPGLSAALNVAAFADRDTGEWTIVWRRRGTDVTGAVN